MKPTEANKRTSARPRRDKKPAVVARLLKRLKSGGDLRKAKVRRVKSALRHEAYFNSLKLEVAADRLAGELMRGDA
jgi:hypothetical protein